MEFGVNTKGGKRTECQLTLLACRPPPPLPPHCGLGLVSWLRLTCKPRGLLNRTSTTKLHQLSSLLSSPSLVLLWSTELTIDVVRPSLHQEHLQVLVRPR